MTVDTPAAPRADDSRRPRTPFVSTRRPAGGRLPEMPSDDDMASLSKADLVELRDQICGNATDTIVRMKLLAEPARDKLPATTDEDDSLYAIEMLLDQFQLEREDSHRSYALFESLHGRVREVAQ